MENTKIEWCDSTISLQMGCDGCELWNPKVGEKTCYAGQLTERYGGAKGWPVSFGKPALFPERMKVLAKWKDLTGTNRPDKPWLDGMPRLVFLDDMGDTFTESLPIDWLAEHLPALGAMPHIIILLTKRANRMLEFSKTHPFPKNFWLLTSVTSAANYNRIEQLMQVRGGSALGVSYEPAWGPVDLTPWLSFEQCGGGHRTRSAKLSWVVSGGSSGATAKPANPEWFRDVRDQCNAADCAYFHKQNGEWSPTCDDFHRISGKSYSHETFAWNRKGEVYNPVRPDVDNYPSSMVFRVGKKKAGALLDGREWREFPRVGGSCATP